MSGLSWSGYTGDFVTGIYRISATAPAGCRWRVRGVAGSPIPRDAAIKTALAEVQSLERDRARQVNQPVVSGFTVSRAYVTSQTASVTDSKGNTVTVKPAPAEAWVIEFTAPPQGVWGSISALQVVDMSTGVAVGGGLWAVPINSPVKGS